MTREKTWSAISPKSVTFNSTASGQVFIATTEEFKVKQLVTVRGNALPPLDLQVKRINSDTELLLGPRNPSSDPVDLSLYTVAASSTISAQEQTRPSIPDKEYMRAVYAEEPAVAIRGLLVNEQGQPYSDENPLPIQIGDVTIDNVGIEDEDGNKLKVNPDGSLNVVQVGIFTKPYDAIDATYPDSTHEVYKSYVGGLAGTLQQTVTVTYADASKEQILSVVRS